MRSHAPCRASGLVSQLMHGNAVHPHAVQARVRRVAVVGEHLHKQGQPSDRRYAPGPLKVQTPRLHKCKTCFSNYAHASIAACSGANNLHNACYFWPVRLHIRAALRGKATRLCVVSGSPSV